MINYRILEMGEQKAIGPVGNIVLSQEVMEVGTLDSFTINEEVKERIIHIIEDMRGELCEGTFYIARYEDNCYAECVGVLIAEIYGLDNEDYPPCLVEPDDKYRIECDIAHHELSTKQKWNLIIEYADKYSLMDSIITLINYYDKNLKVGIGDVLRKVFKWERLEKS